MSDPQPLDVLATPLNGQQLIEASAGTGKTFTLAALYLRLVLGHDPTDPERRPMLPPEILVMTFTRDATRELRDRIRARLAEAARCFVGARDPDPDDSILTGLLDAYPDTETRQRHADHLRAAADWMDEAAIYTIHSFCHRMLQQHAFDAGNPFALELSDDEGLITREAIEDYWRETIYPLSDDALAALGTTLSGKEDGAKPSIKRFAHTLKPLLASSEQLSVDAPQPPGPVIERQAARQAQAIESLRTAVHADLEGFDEALAEAWASKRLAASKNPVPKTWMNTLRPALQAWRRNPAQRLPEIDPAKIARATLEKGVTKGNTLPEALAGHPIALAADELGEAQTALADTAGPFYAHAAHWVARRIVATRRQRGVIGFNDMLTRLRDALRQPEAGERLASVIRHQFPVALVDEFQDTDPVQYRILQAIYPPDADAGLVLIGDPKQAIYSFRGADLATYLQAASRIPETRRYTLARNFRSATSMVDAVNTLFGQSPLGSEPFRPDAIDFQRVSANGRSETLSIDGQPAPGMTLWQLQAGDEAPEGLPVPDYRRQMATIGARRIRRLLDQAQDGKAGFGNGADQRPIRPADIAILVRTGEEAGLIRAALREHGLASVYLSDRDNVLQTVEAGDVLRWLQAMAEPESERRVRTAVGTASLAYDWATLDGLFSDDARWEAVLEQFRDYADRWRRRGVLPALRQLIHDHALAHRLLMRPGGERALSNLLQISELLQETAATLDGPAGLVRWLDEEMQREGDTPADDRILRLESDAALIKVVTIHKSKGLEYPLVFLPFICSYRPARAAPPLIRGNGDDSVIAFKATEADTQAARDRQQAEDMRLLYVAVTRAVHACWLGLAPIRQAGKTKGSGIHLQESAIGRLIGCTSDATAADLGPLLTTLANRSPAIIREPVERPTPSGGTARVATTPPAMAVARTYTARAPGAERWWIASYSALLKDGPRAAIPGTAQADILAEENQQATQEPAERNETATDALHTIPAGPATGTLIHYLLEALANRQFPASDETVFRQIVERGLRAQRWRDWAPLLRDWLATLVETPLPLPNATPIRLNALPGDAFIAELEFLISVGRVRASRIGAIIRRYTLDGASRPGLGESDLNGMVKGYIDLVIRHEGRYWVIDYKSNALGPSNMHYDPTTLRQAVMDKRYDAQYALYLLALHRLLRARLGPDYDYDTHVGGAVCFFLRGIGHSGGGLHAERPDRALVEELDALFSEEVDHA